MLFLWVSERCGWEEVWMLHCSAPVHCWSGQTRMAGREEVPYVPVSEVLACCLEPAHLVEHGLQFCRLLVLLEAA